MKAVAIPYVIALIIGVVVVAVLAYWFISSAGKGSSIGTEAECTARKVEYCTTQVTDVWNKFKQVCGNDEWSKAGSCYNFCSSIVPSWKSTNSQGGSCAQSTP
ncbi:MAG: hypothetical protein HYS80_01010 [Candidatus Aenigmarchaeota archaeon]|nr:hypothetical protein [Candidatus Aenigmarchaeota archaeon]